MKTYNKSEILEQNLLIIILGKNFGTTISPWVVTMEALEQFKVPNMEMKNPILPYLKHEDDYNFDIALEVLIKGENMKDYSQAATSNFKVQKFIVNLGSNLKM